MLSYSNNGVRMESLQFVSRFAAELGWHGLRKFAFTLTEGNCGSLPIGTIVTGFTTTDLKFNHQINHCLAGQFGEYGVTVVADRYHILPHEHTKCVMNTIDEAIQEAARLSALFARANFKNPHWRRRYLEQYPTNLMRKQKWRGWKARLCD